MIVTERHPRDAVTSDDDGQPVGAHVEPVGVFSDICQIKLKIASVESLDDGVAVGLVEKGIHPVVGQPDRLGELASTEVDAGPGMRFVAPVRIAIGIEDRLHLSEDVVAVCRFFTDEVGQGRSLDALSDRVDEGPIPVLVIDVELGSAGQGGCG